MRLFFGSTSRTLHSTSSPTLMTLEGCFTRSVQDISLTWMRPSMPSSNSTNAP